MRSLAIAVLIIATLASQAVADAPLRIHFKNASRMTVDSIHVKSIGAKDWGAEHLHGKSVPPGGKIQILHPGGYSKCIVELWITTAEGKEFHPPRRDLCREHDLTFSGRP